MSLFGPSKFPPESPGHLDFEQNQWTGYLEKQDFSRNSKIVALGPAPPGIYAQLEGYLILMLCKKLSESEKGQQMLKDIIIKYLDTTADVMGNLYKSSAAHPLTGVMNNQVAVSVYERLGLVTPRQAQQLHAWIDHYLGEMLKLSYVGDIMNGVVTLVQGAVSKAEVKPGEFGTAYAGVPALAKLAGLARVP